MRMIETGYEVYQDGELDIDSSIKKIQDSMFARNPNKYGDFLKTLSKLEQVLRTMVIPNWGTRIELFRCVYFAMRLLDDVVDGDTIPPLSLEDRKSLLDSILSERIEYIQNPLYKALAIKIVELSHKLGKQERMTGATQDIIMSLSYDLDRIVDDDKVRSREDLEENFHRLDIDGTIVGTAIIFGIDPKNAVLILSPLGEACRVMYNLRDFGEDILADLINIPQEDLTRYNISKVDISWVKSQGKDIDFSTLPENIKHWFRSEISKIEKLLNKHKENIQDGFQFLDAPNPLLRSIRNIIMKKIILPKTYIKETQDRIPKILEQVS